ncbi:hypothetical protein ACFYPT_38965 [Streptomyces sp. NPDC005529]|uniref:hypothetical protein n=1 Tax=unclassified Streptomyces TaxID=2593676 RepID=UPI0033BCF1CE
MRRRHPALHRRPQRRTRASHRLLNEHDIRVVRCASSTLYLLVDRDTSRGDDALTHLDYIRFAGEPPKIERLTRTHREGTTPTPLRQYGVASPRDVAASYDLAYHRPGEHDIAPVGRPDPTTGINRLDTELHDVEAGGVQRDLHLGCGLLQRHPREHILHNHRRGPPAPPAPHR